MISASCIFRYRKQYPNDRCFFSEPSSLVMIETKEQSFISPFAEDDKIFLERLERSKEHNHNFFYDEWKPFKYDKEKIY